MKRMLYLVFTWPFNDRTDYDRWLGAQVPVPAWVIITLAAFIIYTFVRQV